MFCDLRSFTALSEGKSATELTHFLNDYLTPMTDAVLAASGTVDKYIGDAIMAFWNAPLDDPAHARHAVEAALAMRVALARLNARWSAGKPRYEPVKFGVGLNTGEVCVGNLGSLRRFDYSVIGDEVNVASRLESATKQFGVDIAAHRGDARRGARVRVAGDRPRRVQEQDGAGRHLCAGGRRGVSGEARTSPNSLKRMEL